MALAGTVRVGFTLTETKVADLVTATAPMVKDYSWTIVSGVAASQADLMFSDRRTLLQSANEDLDLSGALATLFDPALLLVKVKAIGIFNLASSPGAITVGRGASAGFTWISAVSSGVVIPAGGGNLWYAPVAGLALVAGTADLVNVATAASTGTYTYEVVLVGTSA